MSAGESITSLSEAVAALGALPMPAGPAPLMPGVDPRVELIRRERTHCEAAQFESEDERPLHVWGPSQYPKREMCQRCTVTREWAEDSEATDVVLLAEVDRLRSEVASLNESLSSAAVRMRADAARIAELEALTPARVQTCRVCGAGYTYGESCSSCLFRARMASELQARGLDGEHYPLVHHSYRVGHDLPETGGV